MPEENYGSRYQVTERIGAGGMADVYKGVDNVLGRTVAIKVLHARLAADPTFAARFRQEAQAAANLQSPNIVNIYDWGKTGDTYYIVMEYVKGKDLKDIIREDGALPPEKVADIGAQVAAALAVAHDHDVIHRDIKPHNIMVQADGTAKVMDFGIARAGATTMTQTGSVLGTAHYVSPEQAQGKQLGAASDLYSLGVVLYEASTGKMPFDADTPVAVALKQVNEQPIAPRQLNPAIPVSLETVILKAMSKNPDARYVSATEMRSDLLAIEAGRAIATTLPSAEETAVMTAVPGAIGTTSGSRASAKKKSRWWIWALVALGLVLAGLGVAWAMGAFGPSQVAVPDVVGLTQPQAEQTLLDSKLGLGDVSSQFDATVPAGRVISQDPQPGTQVEASSTVSIVISKGIEQADVPDVTGKSENAAATALEEAGFTVALPKRVFSNKPEGTVLKQDPKGGSQAPKGSAVTLTVSKGQQLIEVPDVTGTGVTKARSRLQNAGFDVQVVEEFSDTVAEGVVISQNPSSGLPAYKGTTVTITVSKGPNIVTVPSVLNKTQDAAVSQLEALGLVVQVMFQESTPDKEGKVLSQDPVSGAKVAPGSQIDLVIGRVTPTPPGP